MSDPEFYLRPAAAGSYVQDELKQRAVRGASVTVASRLAEHAIHMVSVIVLARLLTPKHFGLVAMVASVGSIFNVFRDLGLSDATIQAPHIDHRQVSTLFWVNSLFGIGVSALFIACSPLIAVFFKEPELALIAVLFSLSFVFAGLSIQHQALMKRRMEFTKLALISLGSSIVSVVAAIAAAALGFGYWAIIVRQVVLAVGLAAGSWAFCRWRPGKPSSLRSVLPMIKFGANIIGFYVMNYFAQNLDKTLIGWRNGAKTLGFYDRAYQLSVMPVETMTLPVQSVAVTTLSKLVSQPDAFKRYYLNALSILAFVGMPLSVFLAVVSKDLVLILLGPQWEATAGIFLILSLGIGIQILYATQGWLHISLGRTDRWVRWGLFSTPVILLSYVLGLRWGITGVALFRTASFLVLLLPGLKFAGKPISLKISMILSEVWRYAFSAAVAGLFCSLALLPRLGPLNIWMRVGAVLIAYLVSYVAAIVIVYRSTGPIKRVFSLLKLLRPNY
jgi:O-antigen/teichoic acid export membrane protein